MSLEESKYNIMLLPEEDFVDSKDWTMEFREELVEVFSKLKEKLGNEIGVIFIQVEKVVFERCRNDLNMKVGDIEVLKRTLYRNDKTVMCMSVGEFRSSLENYNDLLTKNMNDVVCAINSYSAIKKEVLEILENIRTIREVPIPTNTMRGEGDGDSSF